MSPLPEPIAQFSGDEAGALVERQLTCLAEMFDDPDLGELRSRHAGHPAVVQYDHLRRLRDEGVQWPDEFERMQAVGIVGLDFTTWVPNPPYGEFWGLLDEETRKWTVQMIRDPDQYEDVMAELFTWSWLRRQGVPAKRVNVDGQSDILAGEQEDWPCEVKRIHLGTDTGRIKKVLTKANQQIRTLRADGAGTAFISVARAERREAFDDRVPNDITPFIDAARQALRPGQNRSVAQAVISWDDVQAHGEPPQPMLYAFRRRSVVVEHPEPRDRSPYSVREMSIGRTATTWIEWDGPGKGPPRPTLDPIETEDVLVSPQFRSENEFTDGVRANHALEALSEPDAVAVQQYGDVQVQLATRRIERGDHPYTLLVLAGKHPDAKLMISHAYRLYRGVDGDDLSNNPATAFQTLLERYGLDVTVGGSSGRFVPYGVTAPGQGISFDRGSGQGMVNALSNKRRTGWVEHAWVWALDTGRYREATRRHIS
jgi:hypothetical protein